MGTTHLRILLLDDNPDDRQLVIRELEREFGRVHVEQVIDQGQFDRALEGAHFDVIITDFQLRWTKGLDVLQAVKARWPEQPVIMFTATGTQEVAVDAMKAGLDDYVIKSPRHYVRLAVAVRTVLDRREIRLRALRSERRLQTLLEHIRMGIFRLELDGTLLDANGAFLDMLQIPQELRGALERVEHPFLAHTRSLLGRLARVLDHTEDQIQLGDDELETRWLALQLVRVRVNGGEVIDGLVEDVTRLRAAERGLQQANELLEQRVAERTHELEEANKALESFSFSVSHDLREPLRALQGYARAMREDCAPGLSEQCRTYVERIDTVARRLDLMVADLLEFSRVSRQQLTLEAINLQVVVDEARQTLPAVADLDLRRASIQVGAPLDTVRGHYPTLVQVVSNLFSNAIKFVAPDVQPQVAVHSERHGERVRLWITDNGIGIAPEEQARIFSVFERLHGEESYPGTGIGLALVQKAVERMGGQVGVESEPNAGSRFWIELPGG